MYPYSFVDCLCFSLLVSFPRLRADFCDNRHMLCVAWTLSCARYILSYDKSCCVDIYDTAYAFLTVHRYVIHGALERDYVVYEHIEVLVHPLRLHLTYGLATALQDYFQLGKEDEPGAAASKRQADFSKTLSPAVLDEAGRVRSKL